MNFHLRHSSGNSAVPERQNFEALLTAYQGRYRLPPHQCVIFRLMVQGYSNTEIFSELFLAESTVKFHVINISKLHRLTVNPKK